MVMNANDVYRSNDVWVLFDNCPTCHESTRNYLGAVRAYAAMKHPAPIVRVVMPGSHLMPLFRGIMSFEKQQETYPLIFWHGKFHTTLDQFKESQ